ncbi:ABC transporter ATP-binding protein [Stieleria varia]|uniref:Putative multidrug export ATP-binding/permease protein n=1 Tax=Stieleria varia TaxID=2528005 RepID=A0A5C6B7Q3_9BACT|nr:ABC transporter ATP-binding protein [Stieleria varia]TWU07988.1 putative multidrug export ATP-binding/permease protein [Stieleria varia]
MKNFARVLKLSSRRYWSLAGILATSLLIAVLWGANISTLYPMVEIVFNGDTIPQYVDDQIELTSQQLTDLDEQIETEQQRIDQSTAGTPDAVSQALQLDALRSQKQLATASLESLQRLHPWVHAYCPVTPYGTLMGIVAILVGATAIKLIALTANLLLVQYIAEKTAVDLRAIFFRKALRLDLDSFGDNGSADLTARLTNDISLASAGVTVLLGRLVREPLKMAVCVIGAATVCWRLLLLVTILTPIVAIVMQHLSRAIRRASRRAMEEMSQLYGMLNDSFAGIRVVKAFNTQSFERARFNQGTQAYYRKSMKMAFYNTLARGSSEFLGMATVGLAILAGGYLVLNQQTHLLGIRMTYEPLSRGEVLLFFGFLIGASDPARKLADVWSGLQRGAAAACRVMEIIDQPIRVQEPKSPRETPRPHRKIQFRDVNYQYPSGPQVLAGLNLTVRHGETIAVVGPNGSGKSTLISLLCRFDDPQSGQVAMDDVPVCEMRTRDIRRRIALVTQRTTLFDDTIENNIRYGSPGADSHAVVRAAKLAFADDFIRRKTPLGYQTVLGTGGMRLSGGQMQRIALARAFLRDPDILILDEATSQIDLESEHLIHKALAKFLIDRTGVMITHRPTSLMLADRIVVIESGKVSDSGTHEDLIERNRFYQSLCGAEHRRSA